MTQSPAKGTDPPQPDQSELFRDLFQGFSEAICITSRNGRIVEMNPAGLEMFGLSREEMLALNFADLYQEEEDRRKFIGEVERNGRVTDQRVKLRRRDGSVIHCLLSAVLRRDEQGRVVGYQGFIRDNTETIKAMDRLAESEDRYRNLVDSASDGVLLIRGGRFVDCNNQILKMFGCRREEILGRTPADYSPPFQPDGRSSADESERMMEEADAGRPRIFRWRHTRLDGGRFDAEVSLTAIEISGSPHLLAVVRDVTEELKAQELLKRERETFLAILEKAPYGVVLVDQEGNFLHANAEFTNITGYSLQEVPNGRTWLEKAFPKRDQRREVTRIWKKDLASGGQDREFEVVRRDGQRRSMFMRAALLGDGRAIITLADVTERKRAEARLKESEARFRQLTQNAPDIVYTLDGQGSISYVNAAWERYLGHTPEEVLSRPLVDFIKPEDRSFLNNLLQRVRDREETFSDTLVSLVARDATDRPFSMACAPSHDSQGRVNGTIGIIKDVSQRVEAERELRIQKAYLEELFESAPEAVVLIDTDFKITRVNQEFIRLFGYTREEALGRNLSRLIAAQEQRRESEWFLKEVLGGRKVNLETVRTRKGGGLVHVSILGTPIRVEGGQAGIYIIYRDISDRIEAVDLLRESERRHRVVLESAPDPMVVKDVEGRVTYLNPAFTRVFGWTGEQLLGRELDFVPEEAWPETNLMMDKVRRGESFSGMETRRRTRDGRVLDVSVSGASFLDRQGRPLGNVVTLQDITRRKLTEAQLRYIAYHDPLTGLPNRKTFYERVEELIAQSDRRGPSRWALLFLDLDRFKDINDTLGHDMGDLLLKRAADRIQGFIRKSDHVFRLGGDEFTVIVTELKKDIDAARVAEKILEALAEPYRINGHSLFITASMGISLYPSDGRSVEALVRNADTAMYEAKRDGNRYRFFTEEMNSRAIRRLHIENHLRSAIELGQLSLVYQPLVEAREGVFGAEALLRWDNPELGRVPPQDFIPIAEETGLVVELGRWVLEKACARIQAWREGGHQELRLSVNLSPRQFRHPGLREMIQTVLAKTGLEPEGLELEITETSVMEDPEEVMAKLSALHRMGIRLALDDFGTGYSSLAHLKRFPVETLKIDGSFIRGLGESAEDREIIRTIVAMARTLGMEPLAEGVETRAQREFLLREGCSKMQGYLFGGPMAEEEFEEFLASGDRLFKDP